MIGEGRLAYHDVPLSATATKDAVRAAKRLAKQWAAEKADVATTDEADAWLLEAGREEADDRFDWEANIERHERYREEIEHRFVELLGGWDAIAESLTHQGGTR